MPPPARKEILERNRARAAAGEIELDSLGRKKAGTAANGYEELQKHIDPETGVETEVWRRVPPDHIRCRAIIHSKTSPWRGNQCCNSKMKGAPVCKFHGGTLPNVRKAAARRLTLAAVEAADRLVHIALYKKNVEDRDRIKAILAILDRAGVEGKTTVEIEIKPWQRILQAVYSEMPNGQKTIDLDRNDFEIMDDEEDGADEE